MIFSIVIWVWVPKVQPIFATTNRIMSTPFFNKIDVNMIELVINFYFSKDINKRNSFELFTLTDTKANQGIFWMYFRRTKWTICYVLSEHIVVIVVAYSP